MLGAGDRRFVLLDFLLIDLPGVPRGSSATRGYGVGGGSRCAHGGENGEFTPIPWPPSLPSASPTANFGRCKPPLREQPSRSSPGRLPAPLPLAPLRFSGPALAAHLPPAIEMEAAAAGKRHAAPHHPPTHPRQPGQGQGAGWWWWWGKDTPRCQGRQTRGFCLAQPAPRLPAAMTKRSELALALPSANRPAAPTRGKCPARGVGTDPPMPPSN